MRISIRRLPYPVPAAEGPQHVEVWLSPNRCVVVGVRLEPTGEELQRTDPARSIWWVSRVACAAANELVIEYSGEAPVILNEAPLVRVADPHGMTPRSAEPDSFGTLDDRYAALFNARASSPAVQGSHVRQFLVCYDAWTNSTLRAWLGQCTAPSTNPPLSEEATRMFHSRVPSLAPSTELLHVLLRVLEHAPFDRAKRRLGRLPHQDIPDLGPYAAMLCKHYPDPTCASDVLFDKAVRAVAEYQYEIFAVFGRTSVEDVSAPFMEFSAGMLNFVPPPTTSIPLGQDQTLLNSEPDSSLFFVFAEFFWQASRTGAKPGAGYWLELAQLFAAMQEVYCLTYGPVTAPLRRESYQLKFRKRAGPISIDAMRSLFEYYRDQFPNLQSLMERITWNAMWAFHDEL